jgi:hypothetical protein
VHPARGDFFVGAHESENLERSACVWLEARIMKQAAAMRISPLLMVQVDDELTAAVK